MIEQLLVEVSDSDLSMQLSDASSLSSDSEHMGSGRVKANGRKPKRPRLNAKTSRKTARTKKEAVQGKTKTAKPSKKPLPKGRRQSLAKTAKGENTQYCVCRKSYDGKEFMVACDTCQEWFHGRCVGVNPKSVSEHYFCDVCAMKKEAVATQPPTPTPKPAVVKGRAGKKDGKSKKQTTPRKKNTKMPEEPTKLPEPLATISVDKEDEDLDDICPVCDSECTCGTATSIVKVAEPDTASMEIHSHAATKSPQIVVQRHGKKLSKVKKRPGKGKRGTKQADELDEEVVVDDEGRLESLKTNDDHSNISWTDDGDDQDMDGAAGSISSSLQYDSEDDESVEEEEERAIIEEMMGHSDDSSDMNDEEVDSDDEVDEEIYILEESGDEGAELEELEAYYGRTSGRWTSSEEEDDDDDEDRLSYAHDSQLVGVTGESDVGLGDYNDQMLSLVEENGNLFDSIAAAFLQVLEPLAGMSTANGDFLAGTSEDILRGDYAFDFSALDSTAKDSSGYIKHDVIDSLLRRPSLPSSAVTAADQQRQATAEFTSESLSALSLLTTSDTATLPLPINSSKESNAKIIGDLLGAVESNNAAKLSANAALEPQASHPALPATLRTDLKLQEQLLEFLKLTSSASPSSHTHAKDSASSSNALMLSTSPQLLSTSTSSPLVNNKKNSLSRHILPKPSGSSATVTVNEAQAALVNTGFNITDAAELTDPTDTATMDASVKGKKRRHSDTNETLDSTGIPSPSTVASSSQAESEQALVSMDELVDTSQLYTRSSSRSPSPDVEETDARLSRDLNRWQRVPIGAFRLLRSKNRLWLER